MPGYLPSLIHQILRHCSAFPAQKALDKSVREAQDYALFPLPDNALFPDNDPNIRTPTSAGQCTCSGRSV